MNSIETHPRRFDLERFSAEELPREEHAHVVAHLEACPQCQSYVDELALEQKALLALMPADAFAARVVEKHVPREQKRGVVGLWLGLAGLGAATAGLLLFAWPKLMSTSQPQSEQWQLRGKPLVKVILRRQGELLQLLPTDDVQPGDGLRLQITAPHADPLYAVLIAVPASGQQAFVLSPSGPRAFAIRGQSVLPDSVEVDADPSPVELVLIVRPKNFANESVLQEIQARLVGRSPESWNLSDVDGIVWTRRIVPKSP